MSDKIQGLPVSGYTPQSQEKVDVVNENNILVERLYRQIEKLREREDIDKRLLAVAWTDIEKASTMLNKAVFQPKRVSLPEDEPPPSAMAA